MKRHSAKLHPLFSFYQASKITQLLWHILSKFYSSSLVLCIETDGEILGLLHKKMNAPYLILLTINGIWACAKPGLEGSLS
jgi:hypothetical protein